MSKIKTIGVLTSGGDAPGMNAAIRAVVRTAKYYDMKVMGIRKGYDGLINGDIYEMTSRDVSEIMQRGGTMLQTARCESFKQNEVVKQAVKTARYFGIDGMVVIGGDGSFKGARALSLEGMPTIGVPGTIDNDIGCTDYTIGFDTAVTTATEAVDKIRDTSSSHRRCSIVKVMGRHSGMIALNVGIATGAEVVLIPETKFDLENDLLIPIREAARKKKKHCIVIWAEGFEFDGDLEKVIEEATGMTTRTTVLGYIQRGGTPTVTDRVVASQLGSRAVELLKEGIGNRVVGIKDNKLYDIDIVEGLKIENEVRYDLIELAKILSV